MCLSVRFLLLVLEVCQVDTKLVTAKDSGKLFGHCSQEHLWHDEGMCIAQVNSRCRQAYTGATAYALKCQLL